MERDGNRFIAFDKCIRAKEGKEKMEILKIFLFLPHLQHIFADIFTIQSWIKYNKKYVWLATTYYYYEK